MRSRQQRMMQSKRDGQAVSFLSEGVPEPDPQGDQDLQSQNGGDAVAEALVERLVVKDPHSQKGAHAASQNGEEEQCLLRYPADGLIFSFPFGFPLI